MDKPRCKLCGTKHWKNEPCKFNDSPEADGIDRIVQKAIKRKNVICKECIKKDEIIAELGKVIAAACSEPTDRKEYMREYMRKRRSRQVQRRTAP